MKINLLIISLLLFCSVWAIAGNVKPKIEVSPGFTRTIEIGDILVDANGNTYSTGGSTDGSNAWLWVQLNSNSIYYLYSRSNLWDLTSNWVGNNSNTLQNGTQKWDIAYYWVQSNSNDFSYVLSRTNVWDYIFENGLTNGAAGTWTNLSQYFNDIGFRTNEPLWEAQSNLYYLASNPSNFVDETALLNLSNRCFNAIYITNSTSFTPNNIVSQPTNIISKNDGFLQKIVCTNDTIISLPVGDEISTNDVHTIAIQLYIGAYPFTIDTNTTLIETNEVLGAGVTPFLTRIRTNRMNHIMFFRSVGETYFRVYGLDF